METVNLLAVPATTQAIKRETPRETVASAAVEPGKGSLKERTPSGEQVDSALAEMKAFAQRIERNLDFSVDDSSGQVVVKVIDGDSGDVIRQIPSEEILRLSERLEDMRSLLFQAKA
ncbi:flagellar protein FlaG [Stutzerimonas urumqiensis]|uniref:flagellar protein FlaG n=1 Tax=Stutzerimonas urumqiensis TaxID=638269 RepID=UPI000EB2F952|nr:flagellar protein FlaG [Stutzerimonas urumqiensis]